MLSHSFLQCQRQSLTPMKKNTILYGLTKTQQNVFLLFIWIVLFSLIWSTTETKEIYLPSTQTLQLTNQTNVMTWRLYPKRCTTNRSCSWVNITSYKKKTWSSPTLTKCGGQVLSSWWLKLMHK